MLTTTLPSQILKSSIFSSPNGRISFQTSIFTQPISSKLSLPPIKFSKSNLSSPNRTTLLRSSAIPDGGETNEESSIVETREAVAEILQESGISKEEAVEIALGSPKYVQMLIDGVREVDEMSLWDSYRSGDEDVGVISFKKKVFYMAKQKGDNGLLPFLESVGLNPMSSSHVARYLVSEWLPKLVQKVKYVKEMLYPGSENDEYIGKNARRMMKQLSIFVDEDVQQTLSFFEKTEARRGGLKMLGSKQISFGYLVESFPRLLLLSVENHLEPLVQFLEGVGVPKQRIGVIFLLFPPVIFYNIEKDIRPRLLVFEKVGAEEKDIGRMLLKYPWILSTNIQENYDNVLSYLEFEKVPKVSVDGAIRSWPHLLGCSVNKMKMIVEQCTGLGVRSKKLGKVIASSPQLLLRKPHEFMKVVSFIEQLGFDKENIGKILSRCPEIFAASIEETLSKKIKFLLDIGISEGQLSRVIRKYPELLVSDVDNTMFPRMEYFLQIGLSKKEVASMVCRFSPLLGYSIDLVLRPKLEFLVNTMEKPISDIVEYPRYFSYSLDKKIKPRFWVLKGRNVDTSLKDMLGKNNEDFATDFMGIGKMLVPPAQR